MSVFKNACEKVSEITNAFMLFNSNSDLRPKEVKDLALKYKTKEQLVDGKGKLLDHTYDLVNEKIHKTLTETFFELNPEDIFISDNFITLNDCEIPCGEYLNFPCLLIDLSSQIDENNESQRYVISVLIRIIVC